MKLGVTLPLIDIGGEPAVVREFAETAEALGYDFLGTPDHVLGVNKASRPDWGNRNTSEDYFHDPFVLFAFLAGLTRKIHFSTEVLILAQRQAALVAKQAASLDVLSGGRFRLGVGIGWNPVEFTALNENFKNRGRRSEEQVKVMRALWAEPHVSFKGEWHTIEDAGINPLPLDRRVPVWFGGHDERALQRIARHGDGWIMLSYALGPESSAAFAKLRATASAAGRDPKSLGLAVWVSAVGDEKGWRAELAAWKTAGVTHITLNNVYARYHHKRIDGRTVREHIEAMKRYRAAVGDLL
jgi:probable F420-dependent oxidoreductase